VSGIAGQAPAGWRPDPAWGPAPADWQFWAEPLQTAFGDVFEGIWSLHVAAGGWITPVVTRLPTTFRPTPRLAVAQQAS
jgi:hypothetical protein